MFAQADLNNDGTLSEPEFRNMMARNSVVSNNYGNAGNYGSSAYEMSGSGGSVGGDLAYGGAGYGSKSSYGASSSYRSSVGNIGGDLAGGGAAYNFAGADGFSSSDAGAANLSLVSSNASGNVQQYETDAQGLFKDNNPQIVRRPAPNGPVTYTQNIKVRFLQPPAVPPPGVSTLCTSNVSLKSPCST
jgi:hypothetical protein